MHLHAHWPRFTRTNAPCRMPICLAEADSFANAWPREAAAVEKRDLWSSLTRGFRARCPRCGAKRDPEEWRFGPDPLADGLLPVLGDRIQLQQVLLNLILNAAEAMGAADVGARELMISTEQNQAGVLVAVRDSGPGIDPAHLDRVFDAFYTTKSSGTGMGLSICRSIIEAHGGKLWAEANEPRGAVFQFTLPAAQEDS